MTLEEGVTISRQLAHFDRHCGAAYAAHLRNLKRASYRERVLAEARSRLLAGWGVYGDSMFTRAHDDLVDAECEEDADAINYRLGRLYQGWPT
jgi:hypothetical protein